MPLVKGKKAVSANIKELVSSEPKEARHKAILTYAKNHGVDYKTAKVKMAVIIALNNKK